MMIDSFSSPPVVSTINIEIRKIDDSNSSDSNKQFLDQNRNTPKSLSVRKQCDIIVTKTDTTDLKSPTDVLHHIVRNKEIINSGQIEKRCSIDSEVSGYTVLKQCLLTPDISISLSDMVPLIE
jgi:hypothetical protein